MAFNKLKRFSRPKKIILLVLVFFLIANDLGRLVSMVIDGVLLALLILVLVWGLDDDQHRNSDN